MPDPHYVGARENDELRERIEEMWRRYEPYCPDKHFRSHARVNFIARTWELYIGCTLLEAGFKLERPPAKGPDIATWVNGTRLWIEAVAPDSGSGADAVPGRDRRGRQQGSIWHGHPPREESLILRCTSALSTKRSKLAEYTSAGIVAPGDALVIALTLGGIPDSDVSSPDLPLIIKALFGIGRFFVAVSVDGSGTIEKGFKERPEVTKQSGSTVAATFFHEPESRGISGVLYTNRAIWSAPRHLGSDLIFVHNPEAVVALPVGVFPFAEEHYADAAGRGCRKERTVPDTPPASTSTS